jgi:phosphoribosylformimino-5-aminoimidazole carboxamide ribotide isomerase
MKIIPVIDLMNGIVVHARQGRRDTYRPLESPLCRNSAPEAVVEGLLGLHGFATFYVADLDALIGKPRQTAILERLKQAFSGLKFWVDQGLRDHEERDNLASDGRVLRVIGSESLTTERLPLLERIGAPFILSLDFDGDGPMGPAELPERPKLWPETVIVMSLPRVGSTAGPDFGRIESLVCRHPERRWVAAGGVRGEKDLERLEALGVGAVLMASALHSGAVDARRLKRYG